MAIADIETIQEWQRQLCKALDLDVNSTRRIVIDIQANQPIRVYVEQFGTNKLLSVESPKIEWVEKPV